MRGLLLTIGFTFIQVYSFAQFGFTRDNSIQVIKESPLNLAWAGGMDFCQFSNVDLNFDGVMDLFVFDRSSNKNLTFIQQGGIGESDFVYAPEYELEFPDTLEDWAFLADYNCDGMVDIYTSILGGVRVYKNVGTADTGNAFILERTILYSTSLSGSTSILFVLPVDIPSIVDIDADGDLDILSFSSNGRTVGYYKNMSLELYGVCDSLEFETKNPCWGRFRESASSNSISLWDTLAFPCQGDSGEELPPYIGDEGGSRTDRHSGSSLLALDINGSGVMDLVIGDVSYNNLTLLTNSGTEVNTNSGMYLMDPAFPSETTPVELPIFPGAYYVDINNDGKRDFISSPNSKIASENVESIWAYENINEDNNPTFDFLDTDFLQGEMIDVGTASLPIFFDHNGDGLKDLLVSSDGRYDPVSTNLKSRISYFENIGTAEAPLFEFVTDDYQGLTSLELGSQRKLYPTFGDLDGDGDEDMIVGEYSGYCYYFQNTGGEGNPAIFNTFMILEDATGTPIIDGAYVYPKLVDLDRDGDMDLAIGRRSGRIEYYENTGVGTYDFEHQTDELGGVDVSGELSQGHAVPEFVDIEGEYHLIVGSIHGDLYYYDEVDENIDGDFHLVSTNLDNLNIGTYSAPAIYDLNENSGFEMVLGNQRGGVGLFESEPTINIGILPNKLSKILIYPNPAEDQLTIDLSDISGEVLKKTTIELYDLSGKIVLSNEPKQNRTLLSIGHLTQGTYIIRVKNEIGIHTEKLVIQ